MADQVQEILDVPREFLKDGIQFVNRSQKRMPFPRSPSQFLAIDIIILNMTTDLCNRPQQPTSANSSRSPRPWASGS